MNSAPFAYHAACRYHATVQFLLLYHLILEISTLIAFFQALYTNLPGPQEYAAASPLSA